jgi:hypothetical protein
MVRQYLGKMPLLLSIFTIGITVAGLAGLLVTPAAAARQGPYKIWAWHSQQCIDSNPLGPDPSVYQNHCDIGWQTYGQLWHFEDTTGGYYRILSDNWNRKCLNVQGNSKDNSAKVITYWCGESPSTRNDQWMPVYQRTLRLHGKNYDYYRLVNRHSGKCLNVQGGAVEDGADLIQFTCGRGNGNDEFTWDRP